LRIELESGSGLPSVSSPQASVENEKEGSKPLSFLGWLCLRPIDDIIAVSPWDLQLFDSDARNLADDVLERVALLRATFAYGFYVIFD